MKNKRICHCTLDLDGGTRWRSRLRHCATNQKVAGSIPDGVIENFSLTQSFRPHYGPGVDSASNRNEYQEYFLWVKAAGAYGWQPYHLHVPIVLKSGSLLETSGPVQACNGIALPFTLDLWFTECSPDPKVSVTNSKVIRGYISVTPTLKFTYFWN